MASLSLVRFLKSSQCQFCFPFLELPVLTSPYYSYMKGRYAAFDNPFSHALKLYWHVQFEASHICYSFRQVIFIEHNFADLEGFFYRL